MSRSYRYYRSLCFFYAEILIECIFFPVLIARNFILNKSSQLINKKKQAYPSFKKRDDVIDEHYLQVCIHEWGGYPMERVKKLGNRPFTCGLKFQMDRFENYTGKMNINANITISDIHLYKCTNKLHPFKVIPVANDAMDFSGYATFMEILPPVNQYVLLTNSSVSALQVDFIDDYIAYFKSDASLGMLGISYNSKSYQTFLKNNFNPHLQSFFILTTSNVLREVIKENGNYFPGSRSGYKLSIIKQGEQKLSKIVLKLGYKIAVIPEDGIPFSFYSSVNNLDNGFGRWKHAFGDSRLLSKNINSINKLHWERASF